MPLRQIVRYLYQVTPNRSGNFTIPPIGIPGGGSTQPIAFRVDQTPGGQNSRSPHSGSSTLSAPGGSRREEDAPADARGQQPFLRVVLPKKELTVGELVPVELKACFPAGMSASLNGLPMLTGGAFALNKLGDNPEQTREVIDGQPYNVITWSSALCAVQAGDYPLKLELPVMVRVQEKGKRGGGRNPFKDFFGESSPFDDSVFDDFFGQMTEKPLTLHSDGTPLRIQPLPAQGRPADFSGAVGKFDVICRSFCDKSRDRRSDHLKHEDHGSRKFRPRDHERSRVEFDLEKLQTERAIRAGGSRRPGRHEDFRAGDHAERCRTFRNPGAELQLFRSRHPELRHENDEPDSDRDRARHRPPSRLVPGKTPATARATDGLVPDRPEIGRVSSLRPVVLAPWFLIGNGLMAFATAIGLLIVRWRKRRANDPERVRAAAATAAVREALSAMDEAIKERNGIGFFHAARKAVTQRLAERWSVPASRVTPAEIKARLNGNGRKHLCPFQTRRRSGLQP